MSHTFSLSHRLNDRVGKRIDALNSSRVLSTEILGTPPQYGTICGSMGTTEAAWPGCNHTFSTALPSFDCLATERPAADFILGPPNRLAKDFLYVHPVDVLLVLESSSSLGKKKKSFRDAPWMRSLTACSGPTRPLVVICIEESHALVADDGVSSKVVRKRIQQLGYNHTVWFL